MSKKIIDFKEYRLDNGEKVFRLARDLMPLLGYKKWERFLGVINKTIKKNKEKGINTDTIFFYKEPKSTGGRPRVDFELSKYACYLISLECDSKKEEVSFARMFFEHEFRIDNKRINEIKKLNNKIKNETQKKLKIERRYFNQTGFLFNIKTRVRIIGKIIILILFFAVIINLFTSVEKNKSNLDNFVKKITISSSDEKPITIDDKIDKYILDKKLGNINDIKSDFNIRNNFTYFLKGEDLIKSYFIFGNKGEVKESCSLLSLGKCNSNSDLTGFNDFWDKTLDGYNIIDVYKINQKGDNGENIYCVNTNYKLKFDTNPNRINEVFQYKTLILEDGREEVVSRICESITKGDRNIKCPYVIKETYCN